MKIIRLSDGATVAGAPSCAACFGSFDGVHTGHAALLSAAVKQAKESRGELSAAVWMLRGKSAPGLFLSDERERCELFRAAGIEYVFIEEFDEVRDLSPEEFVRDTVIGRLSCRIAVCGYNFRFGRCAVGDAELFATLMRCFGGRTVTVEPVIYDGAAVSSTRIREALAQGDVSLAAALLGRPYSLRGIVAHGKMLGRTLGFPTANIVPDASCAVPRRGVYLTRCIVDGQVYSAVTNVGRNPTVNDGEGIICESHLLSFFEEIYEKNIEIQFYVRLRDERRFDSIDELSLAVKENIAQCAEWDRRIKESGEASLFDR